MLGVIAAVVLSFTMVSCAQSDEADRKALIGLWWPEDGSRLTVEFKADGVFDFIYEVGPPRTTLRLKWELGRKGRVNILRHDGSAGRTCYYTIKADQLAIDNGSGAECLRPGVTPPILMPRVFRRKT